MTDPRRRLGSIGEEVASRHIENAGGRVLARNVRTRHGEIDLIAIEGGALVFVEVKALRAGGLAGPPSPLAAVGPRKRARVRRLAAAWLAEARRGVRVPRGLDLRFDAIGVLLDGSGHVLHVEHVRDAF